MNPPTAYGVTITLLTTLVYTIYSTDPHSHHAMMQCVTSCLRLSETMGYIDCGEVMNYGCVGCVKARRWLANYLSNISNNVPVQWC